jgi:hypothetical protein
VGGNLLLAAVTSASCHHRFAATQFVAWKGLTYELRTALLAESDVCGQSVGVVSFMGEYVTWTFSPNNNGIAHQGRAG